jgi:hypothetical protein
VKAVVSKVICGLCRGLSAKMPHNDSLKDNYFCSGILQECVQMDITNLNRDNCKGRTVMEVILDYSMNHGIRLANIKNSNVMHFIIYEH